MTRSDYGAFGRVARGNGSDGGACCRTLSLASIGLPIRRTLVVSLLLLLVLLLLLRGLLLVLRLC
jgi:hypothetical protein